MQGGSEYWPDWLDPVPRESWGHILDRHAPDAISDALKFSHDTNIAYAIHGTIAWGKPFRDEEERNFVGEINGQTVLVRTLPHRQGSGWFVLTAYPT